MTLAQPTKNRLMDITRVIIFLTDFEFAVLRPVAGTIRKHYHARDDLPPAHMRNVIALDAHWGIF